MDKVYQLFGLREDRVYNSWDCWKMVWERELVAEFSSLKAAEKYVKDSKLAKASGKYPLYLREGDSPYRKRSLLSRYADSEIEEKVEDAPPPFDPVL